MWHIVYLQIDTLRCLTDVYLYIDAMKCVTDRFFVNWYNEINVWQTVSVLVLTYTMKCVTDRLFVHSVIYQWQWNVWQIQWYNAECVTYRLLLHWWKYNEMCDRPFIGTSLIQWNVTYHLFASTVWYVSVTDRLFVHWYNEMCNRPKFTILWSHLYIDTEWNGWQTVSHYMYIQWYNEMRDRLKFDYIVTFVHWYWMKSVTAEEWQGRI